MVATVMQIGGATKVDKSQRRTLDGPSSDMNSQAHLFIELARGMLENSDLDSALMKCLEVICKSQMWDYGEIWLPDSEQKAIHFTSSWFDNPTFGKVSKSNKGKSYKLGEGIPGRAWKEKKAIWYPNIASEISELQESIHAKSGVHAVIAIPIIYKEAIVAVLVLYNSLPFDESSQVLALAPALSSFLGLSIYKQQVDHQLQSTYQRISKLLKQIVEVLIRVVESKDPYTSGHMASTSRIAVMLAKQMHLTEEQVMTIDLAASIHDIGKVGIPSEILSKPGKLNTIEIEMVRYHVELGNDILKDIDFKCPLAEIIYQHHERCDGSGYPKRLEGKDIRIEAKVIMVADTVSAMLSHRPYRPAKKMSEILIEVSSARGKEFDARVVDAFLSIFEAQGASAFSFPK